MREHRRDQGSHQAPDIVIQGTPADRRDGAEPGMPERARACTCRLSIRVLVGFTEAANQSDRPVTTVRRPLATGPCS
jgi:hypothetical protein